MKKLILEFISSVRNQNHPFTDVLLFIDQYYQHQPIAFTNGTITNKATENQGSAKLFRFAQQQNLSQEETLVLFAEHYINVLKHPEGIDHQNIDNLCNMVGKAYAL